MRRIALIILLISLSIGIALAAPTIEGPYYTDTSGVAGPPGPAGGIINATVFNQTLVLDYNDLSGLYTYDLGVIPPSATVISASIYIDEAFDSGQTITISYNGFSCIYPECNFDFTTPIVMNAKDNYSDAGSFLPTVTDPNVANITYLRMSNGDTLTQGQLTVRYMYITGTTGPYEGGGGTGPTGPAGPTSPFAVFSAPLESTDHNLTRFNGTTGNWIEDSYIGSSSVALLNDLIDFLTFNEIISLGFINSTYNSTYDKTMTFDQAISRGFINSTYNSSYVVGPASATQYAIPIFNSADGKTITDSGFVVSTTNILRNSASSLMSLAGGTGYSPTISMYGVDSSNVMVFKVSNAAKSALLTVMQILGTTNDPYLDMNSHRIMGLITGLTGDSATNKTYVDSLVSPVSDKDYLVRNYETQTTLFADISRITRLNGSTGKIINGSEFGTDNVGNIYFPPNKGLRALGYNNTGIITISGGTTYPGAGALLEVSAALNYIGLSVANTSSSQTRSNLFRIGADSLHTDLDMQYGSIRNVVPILSNPASVPNLSYVDSGDLIGHHTSTQFKKGILLSNGTGLTDYYPFTTEMQNATLNSSQLTRNRIEEISSTFLRLTGGNDTYPYTRGNAGAISLFGWDYWYLGMGPAYRYASSYISFYVPYSATANEEILSLVNWDGVNSISAYINAKSHSIKNLITGTTGDTATNKTYVDAAVAAASGGGNNTYSVHVQALTSSPADSVSNYFGMLPKAPSTSAGTNRIYVRYDGFISGAAVTTYSGTAGTSEAWPLYISKQGDTGRSRLVSSVSAATNERVFYNTTLNIPVTAGQYFEMRFINPAWATNPLTTVIGGTVYMNTSKVI